MNVPRRGMLLTALLAEFLVLEWLIVAFFPGGATNAFMQQLAMKGVAAFYLAVLGSLLLSRFSLPVKWNAGKMLGVGMALYVLVFTLLSVLDYLTFNVPPPSLWIFNQSMWNTLQGNFLESTRLHGIYFEDHLALILIFLIPLYALFPHPPMLLLIQSLFIGLGAIPVFYLARHWLGKNYLSLAVAGAYLLYVPLQYIALREFHPVALAIPLLLATFYFMTVQNQKYLALFFTLSLITQETVSLVLAFMGLYAAGIQKQYRVGMVMFLFSSAWFIFALGAAIPYFQTLNPLGMDEIGYAYLFGDESNHGGYINTLERIAANPLTLLEIVFTLQKGGYAILLLLPVGFLSLLHPAGLFIAFPIFAQNLLSNDPIFATIYFHYNALIVPFVFISAIRGMGNGIRWLDQHPSIRTAIGITDPGNALASLILLSALFSSILMGPSPLSLLSPLPDHTNFSVEKYTITTHHQALWEAIENIPQEAVVGTCGKLVTQLSSREDVDYATWNDACRESRKPGDCEQAEYLIFDLQDRECHADWEEIQGKFGGRNPFEPVVEREGVLVLHRTS